MLEMTGENNFKQRKRINLLMTSVAAFCTVFSLGILFFILGYITYQGIASLNWTFLTQLPRPVGETGGGIVNAIVGSLKIVGLSTLIGAPIGILGAIYLSEYGNNKIGSAIRYAADLLNGMPSIIIGVFVYTIIVLPMKHFSALAGSIALAIIMIPLIIRNTEEFVRLVPHTIREAALALGVLRWKMVLCVILPTASRGIITGVLLAVSRIAGETAPLIFTAFGNRFWDDGLLNPIASLPLTIFTYSISPYEDWHKQAWASAMVLILIVILGNIVARVIMRRSHGFVR